MPALQRTFAIGLAALTAAGVAIAILSQLDAPEKMQSIRETVDIDRPVERVYAYVTVPQNWPRWNPATLSVSGATDHSLRVGEQVTQVVLIAGIRTRVAWRVVESSAPTRWTIEGRAQPGGDARIAYVLERNGNKTRFTSQFLYRTPNELLALLDAPFLRPRLEHDAAAALANLKTELESNPPVRSPDQ